MQRKLKTKTGITKKAIGPPALAVYLSYNYFVNFTQGWCNEANFTKL